MSRKNVGQAMFVGDVQAAADYLAPGSIEINRYQAEIFDMVRRRFVLGQRINQTQATGQPSRYFEQLDINPNAGFVDPRVLSATAGQGKRVEKPVTLKALVGQINFGLFDVEVTQAQGQFAYLEAKDLVDTIDAVLKKHDQALWTGSDTDLVVPTTNEYFGISGQITNAAQINSFNQTRTLQSTDSLVDGVKTHVAKMISRTDFEVKPSALYMNPVFADLFDQEAKTFQLYMGKVEVVPGVIVQAIPTQAGLLPIVGDPGLVYPTQAGGTSTQYTGFILSEEFVEYHWLTSPVPRVFQLGLLSNLAAQMMVVKFGAVVAKGPSYAHGVLRTVRTTS